MSHPDGLPDLFLDRSLGRIAVPRLLREVGLRLVTLAEHYGIPEDETITEACREPGPFIYAVHTNRIELLAIGDG